MLTYELKNFYAARINHELNQFKFSTLNDFDHVIANLQDLLLPAEEQKQTLSGQFLVIHTLLAHPEVFVIKKGWSDAQAGEAYFEFQALVRQCIASKIHDLAAFADEDKQIYLNRPANAVTENFVCPAAFLLPNAVINQVLSALNTNTAAKHTATETDTENSQIDQLLAQIPTSSVVESRIIEELRQQLSLIDSAKLARLISQRAGRLLPLLHKEKIKLDSILSLEPDQLQTALDCQDFEDLVNNLPYDYDQQDGFSKTHSFQQLVILLHQLKNDAELTLASNSATLSALLSNPAAFFKHSAQIQSKILHSDSYFEALAPTFTPEELLKLDSKALSRWLLFADEILNLARYMAKEEMLQHAHNIAHLLFRTTNISTLIRLKAPIIDLIHLLPLKKHDKPISDLFDDESYGRRINYLLTHNMATFEQLFSLSHKQYKRLRAEQNIYEIQQIFLQVNGSISRADRVVQVFLSAGPSWQGVDYPQLKLIAEDAFYLPIEVLLRRIATTNLPLTDLLAESSLEWTEESFVEHITKFHAFNKIAIYLLFGIFQTNSKRTDDILALQKIILNAYQGYLIQKNGPYALYETFRDEIMEIRHQVQREHKQHGSMPRIFGCESRLVRDLDRAIIKADAAFEEAEALLKNSPDYRR